MEYKGTYAVIGPPGTGKTTFLAAQVRKLVDQGMKPMVCSLTRTAAAEIASRDMMIGIDENMVGTLHSLAYRSMSFDMMRSVVKVSGWNESVRELGRPDLVLSSQNADDHAPSFREPGDAVSMMYHNCRAMRMDRDQWPMDAQSFAHLWEAYKKETDQIDFTDQIEDALLMQAPPLGDPDIIIADEAQDMSRLEFDLLKMWADYAGALIICGDPWQSLYTWRGADPSIFSDKSIPEDHWKVLKQSYRVPKAVHRVATRWIEQLTDHDERIEYIPTDRAGEIEWIDIDWGNGNGMAFYLADLLDEHDKVMLAASCGYMLAPTLAELKESGAIWSNPWRSHAVHWNPLEGAMLNRIECFLKWTRYGGQEPERWTVKDFWRWAEIVEAKSILIRGSKTAIQKMIKADENGTLQVQDWSVLRDHIRMEVFRELGELLMDLPTALALKGLQSGLDTYKSVLSKILNWWLDKLNEKNREAAAYAVDLVKQFDSFDLIREAADRLYVGTVHSFKGAEADAVILIPDLSPRGYEEWQAGGKVADSVVRLFYVGMTRAKEYLGICSPAGDWAVHIPSYE